MLTSALLILLFGKYCEYSKERSGLHTSSSQTFLPRSSSSGREQKSNSTISELGTLDTDGDWLTVLLLGAAAAEASAAS
jgi:hypothetical protein